MPPKQPKRNGGGNAVPAFDKASLSKLTEQIDRTLETQKAKGLNAGGKRKRGNDDEHDGHNASAKDESGAQKKKKQQKQKQNQNQPKDKRPQEKPQPKEKQPKDKQPKPKQKPSKQQAPPKTSQPADKKAALLDEIKALGGDEADLDLVAGLDSDAEEGGDAAGSGEASLDASFQSELAKFAAGLGFDQVRVEDEDEEAEAAAEEDDDEEEEEEEEGVEEEEPEAEEEEDVEEEEEEAAEAEPEVQDVPQAPKASQLVDPYLPRNPRFSRLMFEPRPDWHSLDLPPLPQPISDDIGRLSATIASLKAYADTLLEADAAAYKSIVSASSSHRFMSTIMTSGTMSDKVSALTLEVQEAPVHNLKTFETLIGLASKRSRSQAIAALGALVDLLGNGGVLPSDRRLRVFHAQPGLLGALQEAEAAQGGARTAQHPAPWTPREPLPGRLTKAHLMAWRYEDWLKDAFFRILQQLEVWCNDEIEYSRTRALDFVYGLLRSKPEQEANLLRLLVDKLGDRERKIASRASYLLLQLLTQHPGMKPIVIDTIEQEMLVRPGQSLRAKYYGINTLNQTILSSKEPQVADTLVRVYFDMFLVLLKSGALGGVDLHGLAPGAKGGSGGDGGGDVATNGAAKGKGKGKGKPAPKDKEKSKNEGAEKDVAEKMVSALLSGVNRAIPFATTDNSTLESHIDTLFRITHSSNFNTSIQALMLVQQVAVSKQIAVDRYYRTLYESLLDPRLVTSSKQAMYLNLLYRSLKNDVDVRRVKAFVKRMLQVATLHQPPFVCGILFMVAELETTFPDLRALLTDPEVDDDDGEEVYRDVAEGDDAAAHQRRLQGEAAPKATAARAGYDGRRRDPEYSRAEKSCLWELMPYFQHYHPSVTAFACNVLARQPTPKPDMANHTLMHFLDKFVYRSPKAADDAKPRGSSIMQPLAAAALAAGASQIVVPGRASGGGSGAAGTAGGGSVNSAAFWGRKVETVAAEDVFFHAYFSQIGKPAQASRASKRAAAQQAKGAAGAGAAGADGGGGGSDGGSDADEDEIWEALRGSRPEIDEDGDVDMDMDDDDDDDLSGLESLLNMTDSDDDDDDEDDDVEGSDVDVDMDGDGGVQFADFSDDDAEKDGAAASGVPRGDGEDVPLDRKKGRDRKKALRALPTFASADDYAEMLGAEEDEDYR